MHGIKGRTEGSSTLFSYFLTTKAFMILYVAGFFALIGWLHMNWSIGKSENLSSIGVSLVIFTFLAPTVYYLAKRLFRESEALFEKDVTNGTKWLKRTGLEQVQEMKDLFSKETEFGRYKSSVRKMLNDRRERYFCILIAFFLIQPLVILDDFRRGFLLPVFQGTLFSWPMAEYSYWIVYWAVVYTLLLSVVWMVLTVARALLLLEKEKPHLHITQSIEKLHQSCQSLEKTKENQTRDLSRTDIGLLDLSFRRFKAGLSPIVNFVLSLSLKIAFVGTLSSIPALVSFVMTREINVSWYGLCVFSCLLSVAVFLIGQYGVWRLWSGSKRDAIRLLDHICTLKTKQPRSLSSKQLGEVEKYVIFVNRMNDNINKLSTVTYTSSSVFKLISVNFLSFAPVITAEILVRMFIK